MYQISIQDSNHNWKKRNLVTLHDKKGHYDLLSCSECGMVGKRYSFDMLSISKTYKEQNVFSCPKSAPFTVSRIKITHCNGVGAAFENLIPGSEHDVVEPPTGESNDFSGVWVMGNGEPVRVLTREYHAILNSSNI